MRGTSVEVASKSVASAQSFFAFSLVVASLCVLASACKNGSKSQPGAISASAAKSSFTTSSALVPSDGIAVATFTVTLLDDSSAPAKSKSVTLTSNHPDTHVINPTTATTDQNGNATFTVSSTSIATSSFTVTDLTDAFDLNSSIDVTFTPQFSYIVNYGPNVLACSLQSTGAIDSCQTTLAISGADYIGFGIQNFDGSTFFYGADNHGHVDVCGVDAATGAVHDCVVSDGGADSAWTPSDITTVTLTSGTYAYVVDNRSPGNVWVCSIARATGLLSNCQITAGGVSTWSPFGVTVAKVGASTYAYLTASGTTVYQCGVSETDGTLQNCTINNGGGTYGRASRVTIKDINGTLQAYIAESANSSGTLYTGNIYHCALSITTGRLSSCAVSNGGASFSNSVSISLSKVQGTLYAIVNAVYPGRIHYCPVANDGALGTCADDVVEQHPLQIYPAQTTVFPSN